MKQSINQSIKEGKDMYLLLQSVQIKDNAILMWSSHITKYSE